MRVDPDLPRSLARPYGCRGIGQLAGPDRHPALDIGKARLSGGEFVADVECLNGSRQTAPQQEVESVAERRFEATLELRARVSDRSWNVAWRHSIEHIGRHRIDDVGHLAEGELERLSSGLQMNVVELGRDAVGGDQRLWRAQHARDGA